MVGFSFDKNKKYYNKIKKKTKMLYSKLNLGWLLINKLKETVYNHIFSNTQIVNRIATNNKKNFLNKVTDYFSKPTLLYDEDFKIWIGNSFNATDFTFLQKNKIQIVLNCSKEVPNFFKEHNGMEYYQYKIEDTNSQKINIDNLVKFCRDIIEKKQNIFVHCFAGASRSVMVSIVILNILTGKSFSTIYKSLTEKRPQVNLNKTFYQLLLNNDIKQK